MKKRLSFAIVLTLVSGFVLGAGCTSIPDSRQIGVPLSPDGGESGGARSAGGGTSAGGATGTGSATGSGGGVGAGGITSAGGSTNSGGSGVPTEGGVIGSEGGTVVPEPSIPCGTLTCSGRTVGSIDFTPCCAGAGKNKCGLETVVNSVPSCVELGQIGEVNTDCPFQADQVLADGSGLPGCCRTGKGQCGVMVRPNDAPNFGCVDLAEVGITTGTTCTPATCGALGSACKNDSDCCSGQAGDGICANLNGTALCTDACKTNADCKSGCCEILTDNRGACAPDKSYCGGSGCRKADQSCDRDSDCCAGNICAPNSTAGPRICRPPCTQDSDCTPELCLKDASGRGACGRSGASLCTDVCTNGSAGTCDDGGPKSDYADCTLGTDCKDCGSRTGGFALCNDSCGKKNGKCEDYGPGSVLNPTCGLGTDCSDCGPRLGICTDDCVYQNDGVCDDGGPNSVDDYCGYGADCTDCGARVGGRGQGKCDASLGYKCIADYARLNGNWDMADNTCQCADCAWDSGPTDCAATTSLCDGKSISACCAPGNPCNWDGDGTCDCGGWCDWEKQDCGVIALKPKCNGVSMGTSCDYPKPTGANTVGVCDCYGVCSWEQSDCATDYPGKCADTCGGSANAAHVHNGICEDGGPGSAASVCPINTDCADCGPR
jgi:hypothetical protein